MVLDALFALYYHDACTIMTAVEGCADGISGPLLSKWQTSQVNNGSILPHLVAHIRMMM
jgi:hypothetical protein